MRSAQTAARGIIIEMKVAIIIDMRICIRYMRNAVRAPTCISPPSTRAAPNQSTAMLETLRISITVGKMSAVSRPTRSDVSVSAWLASANLRVSSRSRTKARTTRMPVSCSRSTRLTVSMRSCIARNWGTMRVMIRPIDTSSAGTQTSMSQDRPRSWRRAMMMPPTPMIGAATSIVQVITTSIWTCCTSLVPRVISEGAPNWETSLAENPPTWWKTAERTSRPNPMAAREP